jgi:hypothetical protein
MASVCRSCKHLVPNASAEMPYPTRLISLQPYLGIVVDSLAGYTDSATHDVSCPTLADDPGDCNCVPEGALFDAVDEHEVILHFLRWLQTEVTGRESAASQRREPAGRPGRRSEDVALAG